MALKKDDLFFYIFAVLSLVIMIISILTFNLYLIGFSSILLFLGVFMSKMWYFIETLIFKNTNLIELFSGYELSGDRLTAVHRVGDKISATTAAFLLINQKNEIDRTKLETVIAHLNYPFKFVMQVEKLNLNKLVDVLQTKRNMKEIELSRIEDPTGKNSAKTNRIKREIEQLEHDITNISTGETPVKIVYLIMTSAISESLYDAEERAKSQIRELTSQFDAILNSKSQIATGHELLSVLQIDSTMVIS